MVLMFLCTTTHQGQALGACCFRMQLVFMVVASIAPQLYLQTARIAIRLTTAVTETPHFPTTGKWRGVVMATMLKLLRNTLQTKAGLQLHLVTAWVVLHS